MFRLPRSDSQSNSTERAQRLSEPANTDTNPPYKGPFVRRFLCGGVHSQCSCYVRPPQAVKPSGNMEVPTMWTPTQKRYKQKDFVTGNAGLHLPAASCAKAWSGGSAANRLNKKLCSRTPVSLASTWQLTFLCMSGRLTNTRQEIWLTHDSPLLPYTFFETSCFRGNLLEESRKVQSFAQHGGKSRSSQSAASRARNQLH